MNKINILTVNHSIIIQISDFIFRSEDILHISCSFSVFSSLELRGTLAPGVEFFRIGEVSGARAGRGAGRGDTIKMGSKDVCHN